VVLIDGGGGGLIAIADDDGKMSRIGDEFSRQPRKLRVPKMRWRDYGSLYGAA
jgi:hypothetical protein